MRFGVLTWLACVTACTTTSAPPSSPYDLVVVEPKDGTAGGWRPTHEQVCAFVEQLPAYLRSVAVAGVPNDSSLAARLGEYACLVRGITVDGQRVLRAELTHRQWLDDPRVAEGWRRGELGIDGGGAGHFEVTFRPGDGAFLDLRVNADR